MLRLNQRTAPQAILNFQDFKASALSGEVVNGLSVFYGDAGRLSGSDLEQFKKDCEGIKYVVRSYATPIAWYTNKWYKVKQKFSVTTSRHQGNLWQIRE